MGAPFIDWISFTLPFSIGSFDFIRSYFGKENALPSGMRGYSVAAVLPNRGLVAYSPERRENRIYVALSSKALSEERGRARLPVNLLCDIMSKKGRITRLDLAMDDKDENCLFMETILDHVLAARLVTRFRTWSEVNSGVIFHDEDFDETVKWSEIRSSRFSDAELGHTIYLGHRSSESFVRIYDKRAQVLAKDENAVPADLPRNWVRFEYEAKGKRAHAIAEAITAGDFWTAEYIWGLVDFKEEGSGDRKSRWETAAWWDDFLSAEKKTRITLPRDEPGLEDIIDWLSRQCSGALYVALQTGSLDAILREGEKKARRNARYQRMIENEGNREAP